METNQNLVLALVDILQGTTNLLRTLAEQHCLNTITPPPLETSSETSPPDNLLKTTLNLLSEPSSVVLVTPVPIIITKETLKEIFEFIGPIKNIEIVFDTAYITYYHARDALQAVSHLHNTNIGHGTIQVITFTKKQLVDHTIKKRKNEELA